MLAVNDSVNLTLPPSEGPLLNVDTTILPLELVDVLNHAYFLHILATDPAQVLPPGKSLMSALLRPHTPSGRAEGSSSSLQNTVEDMIRKAFWNEALESLSNPTPSVQLARLGHLYKDLSIALTPLLPPSHPVLVTLSSPLSPTSAPLLSALTRLREALKSMRERCAPARDAHIDALLARLDANIGADGNLAEEAELVVSAVTETLELAETMKDDLSQFVVGSTSEKQLVLLIRQQARLQERGAVLGLWKAEDVRRTWVVWLGGEVAEGAGGREVLIRRVLKALGETEAVSCDLPRKTSAGEPVPSNRNALPPPFLFIAPSLLYIQNYLQALVIAASLRSLTRLPPPSPSTSSTGDEGADFMHRIWTLLTAEITEHHPGSQGTGNSPTKLINLEDEVLRARRLASSASPDRGSAPSAEEEQTLRLAVRRTLQTTDPVFKLLQKRLLDALVESLLSLSAPQPQSAVPDVMQTGKNTKPSQRPKLVLDLHPELAESEHDEKERGKQRPLEVKGFEDRVMVHALEEAVDRIQRCVEWVEGTWGLFLGGGDEVR